MKPRFSLALVALLAACCCLLPRNASAQITNTVFSDNFSGPLDTNKWIVGTQSLEGGHGNIAPVVQNGEVEITGVTTEQWWAGGSLQAATVFTANSETNVMVSVDRVSENGSGTAHRTALWIMDPTKTFFVLFAEDVGETEWEYNRKIGVKGDVPTGSGTAIRAFDAAGSSFLDGGLHTMKALANGKTVKLYLDDQFGVEVPFPFNQMVFAIGSLARANNDTADTTFANFKVQTIGAEAFSSTAMTLVSGQTASVTVRIPAGVNKTQAVQVRVTTSDPTIAIPVGATGNTLALTFAAGAASEQTVTVKSLGPPGGAMLTLTNDLGMASANMLDVVVVQPPGVRLTDNFAGAIIDSTKWTNSNQGFEAGVGTFTVTQTGGQLVIAGTDDQSPYWAGASLNSIQGFTATPDEPLELDIDRVSINPISSDGVTPDTGARTGVYIATADRSQYVFFGQDVGETGWEVNVSNTGSGMALTQFSSITDTNLHHIKIIADGSQAELFLDGVSGGSFPFAVESGIHFDIGAYARAVGDSVVGVFANAKIANILPPVAVAPSGVSTSVGVNTNMVTVTIPRFLNATAAATVTVTSSNPSVAVPAGGSNGSLTLSFAAGATNVQTFQVQAVAPGVAALTLTNAQGVAVANGVDITVTSPPKVLLSDNFSGSAVDSTKWAQDSTPLAGGTLTSDSVISITNGMVEILAVCDQPDWPGLALFTATSYVASATSPVDFEIDRTKMESKLIGGNTTKEQTGVWIKSGTNYVFFSDYDTHDGTIAGWQFNDVIGATNDTPAPAVGKVIAAFTPIAFNDLGNHHLKVEANGADVKLYLDGVFGAAAPFPFSSGIIFGFAAYPNFSNGQGNLVRGFFANAVVTGHPAVATLGALAAVQLNGSVTIKWTGLGTLQSTTALGASTTWTDVAPAPTGNSYTVTAASLKSQQYFRLRQ